MPNTMSRAAVLSIGWKQISAVARDEMRGFSLTRRGGMRQRMIVRSYLKWRNWRPPFAAHRNLRLNHRSRRQIASQR